MVTTPAGLGHIHPMLPLARAIAEAGHEVRWALPADAVMHAERSGIETVPIQGRDPITPEEVTRRYPEFSQLPPSERPEVMFGKLFGAMAAPPMLDGLLPLVQGWRPDLVVADAAEFAGHIVAAELGVPSVTKGFGPLLPKNRVAGAAEEVALLWRARGLEPRPFGGCFDSLYIDIYPPGLQLTDAPHVPRRQLMRPMGDDRTIVEGPLPLPHTRQDAPLVYVTMGTVFNDAEPLRVALDALGELDVRVIATVGPNADPAVVGAQPPHVRVERYVPQSALLPHCDVVVSHGGSGTALATVGLGLPQLCLPQGADQFLNARALAGAGAAIALMPDEVGIEAVRDAVELLVGGDAHRAAARRIAASIAEMPTPEHVVTVLETVI